MSEPFIAEIKIFAGNFAPRGWAFCDGQLLPIAENTALFSLIGTTYGGDGRSTMGLPNMQDRAPMHPGRGPGLTQRRLGEKLGYETETLSEAEMPSHTHDRWKNATGVPTTAEPTGNWPAKHVDAGSGSTPVEQVFKEAPTLDATFSSAQLAVAGGGQPHLNMQPYLTLNFIIAMVGLYPSRS